MRGDNRVDILGSNPSPSTNEQEGLVTMSFGTLVPVHKLVGGVRGVNKVEILGSISVNQLAYDLNLPYLVACGSAMAHHMDW